MLSFVWKAAFVFSCRLCLHGTLGCLVSWLVCCCWCLAEVLSDELMSCWPTVLSIRVCFPPEGICWEHELSIYLFSRMGALFWQHSSTMQANPQPPCCAWKLILFFIPALTPKPTVTCWAVSLVPWDTLSHQWREGHRLSPAAPAVARMWGLPPVNTKCHQSILMRYHDSKN